MTRIATPKTARLLAVSVASAAMLSGCAQIGSAADAVWSGTKSAAKFVTSPVRGLLRGAPKQDVQYVETNPYAGANVVIYDDSTLPETVSYGLANPGTYLDPASAPSPVGRIIDTPQRFRPAYSDRYYTQGTTPEPVRAATAPADSLAFVKLNGDSSMADWQTCENLNLGYWLIDAAGGRIDPKFESCMRNKGYVLESELALYGLNGAQPVRSPSTLPRNSYTGYAFP